MKTIFSKQNQSKYIAEIIGTFVLVFCGTGAIIFDQLSGGTAIGHLGISITTGLTVAAMIYTVGDISGAHMNPMVTFAFYVAKEFPIKLLIPYILSQGVGAALASLSLKCMFPSSKTLGETMPSVNDSSAFILEIILAFILVFVILHVAKGSKEQGMFAGIAIGSTVLLEVLFAGPICGASMNPIRSIVPAVISGKTEHLWIYIVAPFIGSFIAVYSWKILKRKD
jgi:aquaporin NIP